jgi:ABC-2 type transport system ATP-binding protein
MSVGTIEVHDLVKTFKGEVKAVQGVSFQVANGEFFSFLGPNGAGKSTTIQVLTTLLRPTSGKALISGYDVDKQPERVRKEMGVALQDTGIDPMLTGRELVELQAKLFGFSTPDAKKRTTELLELINLQDDANRRIGKYSGGMRRRLDLALSLVHSPKILFLDEPTTGLDPTNRLAIWDEIRRLNKEMGTTIFLTTQYLEEADQLSDRIAIIQTGKIVATGTPAQLKTKIGMDIIDIELKTEQAAQQAAKILKPLAKNERITKNQLRVYVENGSAILPEIVRALDHESLTMVNLNLSQPTLDDVFIQVTGDTLS